MYAEDRQMLTDFLQHLAGATGVDPRLLDADEIWEHWKYYIKQYYPHLYEDYF
jgi:hypothetical protein